MLFLDLLKWEVERDVFSKSLSEQQAARSPYGVRAGFIGLDYVNELSIAGLNYVLYRAEVHGEPWAKYLPYRSSEQPHTHGITNYQSIGRFVNDLYRQAYAAHGERIYTRLVVPRRLEWRRSLGNTRITLTPPLFALKLRPIDTVGNTTRRVFPVIFHAQGGEKGMTKVNLLERAAVAARWLVPMVHSRQAKNQAMVYLLSVPLFLSTSNSIVRDSYHAQCGFPFEETIRKVKNL